MNKYTVGGQKVNRLFLSLLLMLLFTTCSTTITGKKNEGVNVSQENEIEKIYWIIYNKPKLFDSNWNEGITCIAEFSIKLKNPVNKNEIVKASFINEDCKFDYTLENNIDYEKGIIGTHKKFFIHGENTIYTQDTFFIGKTTFYVLFSDGHLSTYVFDIPSPGTTASNDFNLLYTEDLNLNSAMKDLLRKYKMIDALKRPIVTDYSISSTILSLNFTETDKRFFSGVIIFFDENNQQVANSDPFRMYDETRNILQLINSGTDIYKDGKKNAVTLDLSKLNFNKDKTIDNIFGFYVLVTDGEQYASTLHGYDCASFSERKYIK
jgi:hypothetical protein